MFKTYGSTTTVIGKGIPIWKRIVEKLTGGASLGILPSIGQVYPMGSPVVFNEVGRIALPIEFYKVSDAVTASVGAPATEISILAGDNYEVPIIGDKIKVLSTGVELTISNVADANAGEIVLTVSSITANIAKDAILYLSEHDAKDIDVANFKGLTGNNVHAEVGTTYASVDIVTSGTVYGDRVPFVPQEVKSYISNIIFDGGI